MSTTTGTTPADALSLLRLPNLKALSDQQRRGVTCAWDGITLAPETAVDLGPRPLPVLDRSVTIFPRGCRGCAGRAAYQALFVHAPDCDHCKAHPAGCPVGDELRRLAKGARL
ncbi:hypothetical protein ACWC3Y_10620 [Streptomyces sp. NPDC001296]